MNNLGILFIKLVDQSRYEDSKWSHLETEHGARKFFNTPIGETTPIYVEIQRVLKGSGTQKIEYLRKLRSEMAYQMLLEGKSEEYYKICAVLWDGSRNEKIPELNCVEEWTKLINLSKLQIEIGHKGMYGFNYSSKEALISKAVTKLRSYEFVINTCNGNVNINENELNRLTKHIVSRIKSIGGKTILHWCFEKLKPVYDQHYGRYFIKRHMNGPAQNKPLEFDTPYGYLIALGVRFIGVGNGVVGPNDEDLFKAYAGIYEMQKVSVYENMLASDPEEYATEMMKQVRYDSIFNLNQYNYLHVEFVIKELLDHVRLSLKQNEVDEIEDCIDILLGNVSGTALEKLDLGRYNENERNILESLFSKPHNEINLKVGSVLTIENVEHYLTPLIIVGKVAYCLPAPISSISIYERTLDWVRSLGSKDQIGDFLGECFENILVKKLIRIAPKLHHGKKYLPPSDVCKQIGVSTDMRECDIIIETETVVYLIEMKKKVLTRVASGGDFRFIIQDVAKSLIDSQIQIGLHEITLREKGLISFIDGTKIELKNRSIERISCSEFDFKSLQDISSCGNIFRLYLGTEIKNVPEQDSKKNQDLLKPFNKSIKILTKQFEISSMKSEYSDGRYMNVRWLSLFQFLTLIENAKNWDGFVEMYKTLGHVSDGTMDWYYQYAYWLQLKSKTNT